MSESDCKSNKDDLESCVDSVVDENEGSPKNKVVKADRYELGAFDVWALGITIVIGGQYFSWNFGYAAGFGSCCITFALIGSAYLCLVLSIAEISSGLPFEGGQSVFYPSFYCVIKYMYMYTIIFYRFIWHG